MKLVKKIIFSIVLATTLLNLVVTGYATPNANYAKHEFWETIYPYKIYDRIYEASNNPTSVLVNANKSENIISNFETRGFDVYALDGGVVKDYSNIYANLSGRIANGSSFGSFASIVANYYAQITADSAKFTAGTLTSAYALFNNISSVNWLTLTGPNYATGGRMTVVPIAKIANGSNPAWYDSVVAQVGTVAKTQWVTIGYEKVYPYRYYEVLKINDILMNGSVISVAGTSNTTKLPYIFRYSGKVATPKVSYRYSFTEAVAPFAIYDEVFLDGEPTGVVVNSGRWGNSATVANTNVAKTGDGEIFVFMYHLISDKQNELSDFCISPQQFESDVKYLTENGFKLVTATQLSQMRDITGKIALLTFDDGYANNYNFALPILKKYNAPATMYVVGSYIDKPWYLTTEQLKMLVDSNLVEIGNHSYELHNYTFKDIQWLLQKDDIQAVVNDYKKNDEFLRRKIGKNITSISYPYGVYTPRLVQKLKVEMPFSISFSTLMKTNNKNSFNKPLNRINRSTRTDIKTLIDTYKSSKMLNKSTKNK